MTQTIYASEAKLRNPDFSSPHAPITTLVSLAVITLTGIGIRLLTMATIQRPRERMNRQIDDERLRALIADYKTFGGSFTAESSVDPTQRRDLRRHPEEDPEIASTVPRDLSMTDSLRADRAHRIRDAGEAPLSDIVLLGTKEHSATTSGSANCLRYYEKPDSYRPRKWRWRHGSAAA